MRPPLRLARLLALALRELRVALLDAELARHGLSRRAVVARHHHRPDAHRAERGKALLNVGFDDVFEVNDAEQPVENHGQSGQRQEGQME